MDGTLIDSEPYWIDAEMRLAARFGVPWTHEDGLTLVGNTLEVSARTLIERGIDLPLGEVIDCMVTEVAQRAAESMPWLSDARALLGEVVDAGIPCALVTMSIGAQVENFLDAAGHVFDAVVTGDQVSKGKPDPEAYLTAAARLGVDPKECVAIEDSPGGVRAAHGSGAATIGVRRHVAIPEIEGVTALSTLDGLHLEDLARVLQESRDCRTTQATRRS